MTSSKYDLAVIGAGAAGMISAATLLEKKPDAKVLILEKNRILGAKVIISGGGRCNVTTGIRDKKILLQKYFRGAEFLKKTLGKFSPKKVYQWFEDHGLALKIEADQRVFPKSNNGQDVTAIFAEIFDRHSAHLAFGANVLELDFQDDVFLIQSNQGQFQAESVVLATGGNAYSHTGSSGDGYHFARHFGHQITQLGPSLSSFLLSEKWPTNLSGISLENADLQTADRQINFAGPMIFTHFGFSGPAVFALSSLLAFREISAQNPAKIFLRPDANRDAQAWDSYFRQAFELHPKASFFSALKDIFPKRFANELFQVAQLDAAKKSSEVSKAERLALAKLLGDGLELNLIARRPGDEFVTAGGVETAEVDNQTMESKLQKRLYIVGELLNVDGVTGGFNLQASWATGMAAGTAIAESLSDMS